MNYSFLAGTLVVWEWEIGLNVYNLEYQAAERRFTRNDSTLHQSYSSLLLLNAKKAFDITDNVEVAIGAQTGVNLTPTSRSQWVGYVYTNLAGSLRDEHYNWSLAAYTANPRFTGEGPRAGSQVGFDAGIFCQKVHLLGDWLSGPHELDRLVLGAELFLGKHFPLAIGWQRANRDGAQALLVQLTCNPE